MAISKEEPVQKVKQTPPLEKNSPPSKVKCIISLLTALVALIALGTAAYTFFLNQQIQKELDLKLSQLEQKQEEAQEQINKKTQGAEEAQAQLEKKITHLKTQVQNAMNQRFYQKQDWLLLKARYYLELAQINAHWSTNFESTVALLNEADTLLKQFNEPQIFAIRQAIAKDIAQVQANPQLDSSGVLSQLDAAQNSVNDLSIPLLASKENEAEKSSTSTNKPSSWKTQLQESMGFLEKLVVIRHHEHAIKPLMSPLLEALLKERLQLNLQEAQWAILNNNSSVYQLALNQAIKNLTTHFNPGMANTAALIKKLTQLQEIKLNQTKPSVDSALPLLNELIDSKKAPMNQSTNTEAGGLQND
jgi:uroporphyrin-3 C-methyltransferase